MSNLIRFLNHSIWSFLAQVMAFLPQLAGLVHSQIFWADFGSDNFDNLNLVSNLNWLGSKFWLLFFTKVVLLCLSFPWVQESGHLDLFHKVMAI